MTRDELILRTRALVEDGERIERAPSIDALRSWLALSDALLAEAWGTMDRYHLVWLSVGHPRDAVRERPMSADEEEAYVREVAAQKTAALRMSLDAVERQGMPFLGEDRAARGREDEGPAAEAGTGTEPTAGAGGGQADGGGPAGRAGANGALGQALAERIREARERTLSEDPSVARRAPNPERMRR